MTFKSKSFKIIFGSLVALIALVLIIGVTGGEDLPDYEIVENDDSRDNVLMVRAVTDETDQDKLEYLAEHLQDEIRDTSTFDGLNTFAAYIRIHDDSNTGEYGNLLLDSKIAYRSEGLPITGLDETNELYIEN
ncbi:hypothetical protein [Salipaludibacillus aurantiacus]|uniref:Uncharacterized protein n=1 Tax=Salipaludibacillus aurantiacus TaxID=1601833 RepID=A0A1H9U240_9BACI|nr:hypothetical protein [Salipaludibacillus aurantiacus]SES03301.1 hypothetical protein SAMN05518684_106240 [Salipaludibacillus aurantiacus]